MNRTQAGGQGFYSSYILPPSSFLFSGVERVPALNNVLIFEPRRDSPLWRRRLLPLPSPDSRPGRDRETGKRLAIQGVAGRVDQELCRLVAKLRILGTGGERGRHHRRHDEAAGGLRIPRVVLG